MKKLFNGYENLTSFVVDDNPENKSSHKNSAIAQLKLITLRYICDRNEKHQERRCVNDAVYKCG